MIRSIMNIRLRDKVRIAELRKITKIGDIGWKIKKLKFGYAGHLVGGGDDKCSKRIKKWTPLESNREGAPNTLEGRAHKKRRFLWHRTGLNRKRWKRMVDTYARR